MDVKDAFDIRSNLARSNGLESTSIGNCWYEKDTEDVAPTDYVGPEAKLRPSEIELNLILQLYIVQTIRLDPYHPLRIRAENITKAREYNFTLNTRFARLITTLLETEYINPLAFLSWEIRESRVKAKAHINSSMSKTKIQTTEDFKAFYTKIPRSDIQIFSDNSKSKRKSASDESQGI
ncbi:hypothetical protein SS1G_07053 [Sclerotinia sclerotiorum 1980 UF-70]|uniref:Uncharacterized protein n=1 Tax=Sclerotinia sclerotiorum (strain ATCC 18683 / 1980 / Ss-1) TaxID=665079 RepID=A7EP04_SCLS1|nr:hypothetical protein SS1G_07053 [Sclerotinia sclerotiorum 1980 UF-70]EDO04570.1 hypothetical protein SS1G_07053 [Sclerotinia sclerotiorum 1980 UF-70]